MSWEWQRDTLEGTFCWIERHSLAGKRAPVDGRGKISLKNSLIQRGSPRIWILQKNTARLWVLFISDTMPSFLGACTSVIHAIHLDVLSFFPEALFYTSKPKQIMLLWRKWMSCTRVYSVCAGGRHSFLSLPYMPPQLTHRRLCRLFLSSVCLPLSSHFPPPASPRVPAVSSL